MSMPLPPFVDPTERAAARLERAGLVAESAAAYRATHDVRPAREDTRRIAAFGIDCQLGFCAPGASLFVPGAVEDMQRATLWLYRNLDRLTSLTFSLDTHRVFQIFHPAFWRDEAGRPPAPLTPISHADVATRRFVPADARHDETVLEYTRKLEHGGRYVLHIWPYHTLLGGVSHALVPSLMEASVFHALVRETQTRFEVKGEAELTEMYSVFSPEVRELGGTRVGAFNEELFDALLSHDRVYIFGEAKSHCVLSTLNDLTDHIEAKDPSLAAKVFVLTDAMSPVPPPPLDPLPRSLDFPRLADEGLLRLASRGIKLASTPDDL